MRNFSVGVVALLAFGFAQADDMQLEPPKVEQPVEQRADQPPPQSPLEYRAKVIPQGGLDLAADRGKALYIEFSGSPRLTEALRAGFSVNGFKVVTEKDAAEVVYQIDGGFDAVRPATRRTAKVTAGELAERPEEFKTTSGRGVSVMFSANPIVAIVGTIASNIGDLAGARDATNNATAGDPDGACLAKCEGWVYRQGAALNLTRSEAGEQTKVTAISAVAARNLQPGELFNRAAAVLFGSGVLTAPLFVGAEVSQQ